MEVHWYNEILIISVFLGLAILRCVCVLAAATACPARSDLWAPMFWLLPDRSGGGGGAAVSKQAKQSKAKQSKAKQGKATQGNASKQVSKQSKVKQASKFSQ